MIVKDRAKLRRQLSAAFVERSGREAGKLHDAGNVVQYAAGRLPLIHVPAAGAPADRAHRRGREPRLREPLRE